MRVLLTGGTGMIGANLSRRLLAEGYRVCLLVRTGANLIRLQGLGERLELVEADLTDAPAVKAALDKTRPQIVFHLASTRFNPPTIRPEEHFKVNVLGTLHLLEALREFSGTRLVFTGSAAAYGHGNNLREEMPVRPDTALGASKACASVLLQTYSRMNCIESVELRLFAPYGPWEHPRRLVPHVILSALEGIDLPLTEGKQQRDFVYMDDVVDALVLAGTRDVPPGSVFNIGSGNGTKVRQVAELILDLMERPVKLLVGALPTRHDEIVEMSADITAAREVLGWKPSTSLTKGLGQSIRWFTEHRRLAPDLP